ncbi:sister chromatid cohesion C-terminus-domain-containing protein [Phlyctochytrium arcticum]|nr:sister chromatid cohesion C-terminus-domain-containing protein [Phlyctochytrium arcticum]
MMEAPPLPSAASLLRIACSLATPVLAVTNGESSLPSLKFRTRSNRQNALPELDPTIMDELKESLLTPSAALRLVASSFSLGEYHHRFASHQPEIAPSNEILAATLAPNPNYTVVEPLDVHKQTASSGITHRFLDPMPVGNSFLSFHSPISKKGFKTNSTQNMDATPSKYPEHNQQLTPKKEEISNGQTGSPTTPQAQSNRRRRDRTVSPAVEVDNSPQGKQENKELKLLTKLEDLLEAIFHEEDAYDADSSSTDINFSNLRYIQEGGLLRSESIHSLEKLGRTLLSSKVFGRAFHKIEISSIRRLFESLERKVRDAEARHLKGFAISTDQPDSDETPSDLKNLDQFLESLNSALMASLALFLYMTGTTRGKKDDSMQQETLRRDPFASTMELIKALLDDFIIPLAGTDVTSTEGSGGSAKYKTIKLSTILHTPKLKAQSVKIITTMSKIFELLPELIENKMSSEHHLISIVYASLKCVLLETGTSTADLGINGLQMKCLYVCNAIFRCEPDQRNLILEEFCANCMLPLKSEKVIRMYRLPDGAAIQLSSALLLHLINGFATGMPLTEAAIELEDSSKKVEDPQSEQIITNVSKIQKLCQVSYDSAVQATRRVIAHCVALYTRANTSDTSIGKGRPKKAQAMSGDIYRILLENLLHDLMAVYATPEWPAAELLISEMCRAFLQILSDPNKSLDTACKIFALESIGGICARLRQTIRAANDLGGDKQNLATDPEYLDSDSYRAICSWMHVAEEDPSLKEGIKMFHLVSWVSTRTPSVDSTVNRNQKFVTFLCSEMFNKHALEQVPDLTNDQRKPAALAAQKLALVQPLAGAFDPLMLRLLSAVDSDVVTIRTRAIKALQSVFVSDSTILGDTNIRKTIESRMMDSSITVRDAAVDLVGKFLTQAGKPLVREYFPMISARSLDVGINVRKRIVKIMREIWLLLDHCETKEDACMKEDIAAKLLARLTDAETSVQDLAWKTLQELLFSWTAFPSTASSPPHIVQWDAISSVTKTEVGRLAKLLMSVVSDKDVADEFNDLLVKCNNSSANKSREMKDICLLMCEYLMEGVICAEEQSNRAEIVQMLTIIEIFSKHQLLSGSVSVRTLYPYMQNQKFAEGSQEDLIWSQKIMQSTISIIRNMVQSGTSKEVELLAEVEDDLIQLLNKGTQQLVAIAIPCLCSIVQQVTRNYAKLHRVFKKCLDLSQKTKKAMEMGRNVPEGAWRMTWRCMLILGQLPRYAQPEKDVKEAESATNIASMLGEVAQVLSYFFISKTGEATQSIAVTSMVHICIASPRAFLRDDVRQMMQQVLMDTTSENLKLNLLRGLLDYLRSEQKRAQETADSVKESKEVDEQINIDVLIGSATGLGDAGISSMVIQTHLIGILKCLLTSTKALVETTFEVVEHILEQGLVHPLLCVPSVVAMEASHSDEIRARAFKLHQQLVEKHASFIHSKNVECVRLTYTFLSNNTTACIPGYFERPSADDASLEAEAVFQLLYSLVQGKKSKRNEFLNVLLGFLDPATLLKRSSGDLSSASKQSDARLRLFVAENLAVLKYKWSDEVLHVVRHVDRTVAVHGLTVLHEMEERSEGRDGPLTHLSLAKLADMSCALSILTALRVHLETLYGLNALASRAVKNDSGTPHRAGGAEKEKLISRDRSVHPVPDWKGIAESVVCLAGSADSAGPSNEILWAQCLQLNHVLKDIASSSATHDQMDVAPSPSKGGVIPPSPLRDSASPPPEPTTPIPTEKRRASSGSSSRKKRRKS